MPHIDNNIWVKAVHKQITDEWKKNPCQKFVVTDIRFDNELQIIKELGGVTVRVTRPKIENTDTHSSETQISQFDVDYDLLNDTTIENLYDLVDCKVVKLKYHSLCHNI